MACLSPAGLANHAKMLSDYLYDYGSKPNMWSDYSKQFFVYLLSTCWKKLYKQFSLWQGLSLIQNLEEHYLEDV